MKRVVLPRTDLVVSRLSLGSASLHHVPTHRQRQRLLAAALDCGITHFDTAPLYGYGLAEREIGRFAAKHSGSITVATKVGLYPPNHGHSKSAISVWTRKVLGRLSPRLSRPMVDWTLKAAALSFDHSLQRLQRDYVDILFLHEPLPGLIDDALTLAWLQALSDQGKIRYWGLAGVASGFERWIREDHELAQILQVRDRHHDDVADLIHESDRQLQFTYGCLRRAAACGVNPGQAIRQALSRNSSGSVLVSSRKAAHIEQLIDAAQNEVEP